MQGELGLESQANDTRRLTFSQRGRETNGATSLNTISSCRSLSSSFSTLSSSCVTDALLSKEHASSRTDLLLFFGLNAGTCVYVIGDNKPYGCRFSVELPLLSHPAAGVCSSKSYLHSTLWGNKYPGKWAFLFGPLEHLACADGYDTLDALGRDSEAISSQTMLSTLSCLQLRGESSESERSNGGGLSGCSVRLE